MTTSAQKQRVDAPQIQPPVMSLLASANLVITGTDTDTTGTVNPPSSTVEHDSEQAGMGMPLTDQHPAGDYEYPQNGQPVIWIRGFSYRPEGCNGGGIMDPDGTVNTPTALEDQIDVVPFLVEGSTQVPTFGAATPELRAEEQAKARRQLLACESKQIGKELWTGTLSQAQGFGNRYLSDSHCQLPEGDRIMGYVNALAALERYIRADTCGQQGMIHARADTVSIWDNSGALRRVGNLILTTHDTIVVSDPGYDGSRPSGGGEISPAHPQADSAWAYATTVVDVRRGAFVAPQSILERSEFRTTHQTLTTFERRPAAVTWGCLQIAVHVDHVNASGSTGS